MHTAQGTLLIVDDDRYNRLFAPVVLRVQATPLRWRKTDDER